jgi:hypothetical protein
MRKISVLFLLLLAGCQTGGIPGGAVAGCGSFEYTGTFTKSSTSGRALWLSDSDIAKSLTVDQVIALAESMDCAGG